MRAMLMTARGGPEVLRAGTLPDPQPGPGQVLIRVRATALNHLDLWVRSGVAGRHLPLPHLLGSDVAGEVTAIGPQVEDDSLGMQGARDIDNLTVGDRVLVNPGISCGRCRACLAGRDNLCPSYRIIGEHVHGGYGEYLVVPRQNVETLPTDLSFSQGAAIPLASLTAWQMVQKARVQPGETVLVMAAGSGVSTWAIQIARLHGATVIAVAGSDEKTARARALGAEHTINYRETDYVKAVKAITNGQGVEVALDHTGADNWGSTIHALAWGGRLVTCGATSGNEAVTPLAHVFYRQLEILGSTMASKSALPAILDHVRAGRLKPAVATAMPLDAASEAHRLMESRDFFGKIVLEV
jgi:NADPH:quinone reductase-like Zn-dependent oxidoreductase